MQVKELLAALEGLERSVSADGAEFYAVTEEVHQALHSAAVQAASDMQAQSETLAGLTASLEQANTRIATLEAELESVSLNNPSIEAPKQESTYLKVFRR